MPRRPRYQTGKSPSSVLLLQRDESGGLGINNMVDDGGRTTSSNRKQNRDTEEEDDRDTFNKPVPTVSAADPWGLEQLFDGGQAIIYVFTCM